MSSKPGPDSISSATLAGPERRLDLAFLGLGALVLVSSLAIMPRATAPGHEATNTLFMGLSSLFGALILIAAGLAAFASSRRLEQDNPARRPWALMAAGLVCLAAGEAVEAVYALAYSRQAPFPSLADAPFLAAYPLLAVALWRFLRAYRVFVEPEAKDTAFSLGSIVVLVAIGLAVSVPAWRASTPLLERLIGIGYVALDIVLLIPLLRVLRFTWRMRGGRVFRVWGSILLGFLLTSGADVLFAWIESGRLEGGAALRLDFLVEVLFALSYLAILRGTLEQYRLLGRAA